MLYRTLLALLIISSICYAVESLSVPLMEGPVYFKVTLYKPTNITIVAGDDEDLAMELKNNDRTIFVDDKKDYGRDKESYEAEAGEWLIKVFFAPDSTEQTIGSFTIRAPGHNIYYIDKREWSDSNYSEWYNDIEMPSETAEGDVSIFDGFLSLIFQFIDVFF
ncbi:MAG: hypothetical protein J7K68_04910 [Candidatus Diapherotrites archaeon]|nr:hypothetical protein [Candidatus Diapherotrites archaeon]